METNERKKRNIRDEGLGKYERMEMKERKEMIV